MAIHEYRCHDGRTMFQALMRGDHTVTCPHCGGASMEGSGGEWEEG